MAHGVRPGVARPQPGQRLAALEDPYHFAEVTSGVSPGAAVSMEPALNYLVWRGATFPCRAARSDVFDAVRRRVRLQQLGLVVRVAGAGGLGGDHECAATIFALRPTGLSTEMLEERRRHRGPSPCRTAKSPLVVAMSARTPLCAQARPTISPYARNCGA
ncbi:hypothetical protein [Ornithinimicrobium kibberense]|uniref:hypothetical protein n=1 Tax=Ornithinimicrobium kibberense TaxID=282060 RepID=UPI00361C78D0